MDTRFKKSATSFLLLHGQHQTSATGRRVLFGCALLAGLLAWKCKEEAITLPIVLSGLLWLGGRRLPAASVALVPAALVAARWSDISRLTSQVAQNQELVIAGASPVMARGIFFMTEVKSAVFYYLGKFLVPVNLNVDPYVKPVNEVGDLRFLAACLVLVCCVALTILIRRKQPMVSFGFIALLASPLTAYAIMPMADVVAEHRVYSAGLGMALLAAYAATLKPKVGVPALSAAVVALSFATFERNKVWAGEESLWRDAELKSPQLERPHLNLDVAYQAEGRYSEAMVEYEHALSVNPRLALAYSNMGSVLFNTGDLNGAEAKLKQAIALSPSRIGPYISLARIRLKQGAPADALHTLSRTDGLDESAAVHFVKGEAYFALRQYSEAAREYARAEELGIGPEETRRRIYSRMREIESSILRGPTSH